MPTMNISTTDGAALDWPAGRSGDAKPADPPPRVAGRDAPIPVDVDELELQTCEPRMQAALGVAFKAAASQATVLLRGESGAGKDVLARAIHAHSPRAAGPLVTVYCAGLSADLLETELFGHAASRGGDGREASGKVALAEGGTLLLSEVADVPLTVQAKILRLLREGCFERPGEAEPRRSDVRVLAATNGNLDAERAAGHFLEDLFYELTVMEVTVPPLRERPGDILPLAERLLRFYAQQEGKSTSGFAEPVRDALVCYAWPGNIRELRNAIERGVILAAGPFVVLADLPSQIGNRIHSSPSTAATPSAAGKPLTLEQMEAEYIRRVMASAESIGEAATKLGINPSTLYRKRKRYGI